MRGDDGWSFRELGDLVAWLPAGCALWQSMGGPAAFTQETHALREANYTLRVMDWRTHGKGNFPKPQADVPAWHEKTRKAQDTNRRAEAYEKRQARRQQQLKELTDGGRG